MPLLRSKGCISGIKVRLSKAASILLSPHPYGPQTSKPPAEFRKLIDVPWFLRLQSCKSPPSIRIRSSMANKPIPAFGELRQPSSDIKTSAVISDFKPDISFPVLRPHFDLAGIGMFPDVCQNFLEYPVQCGLHPNRKKSVNIIQMHRPGNFLQTPAKLFAQIL